MSYISSSHMLGSVESGFNRSHRILADYLHDTFILCRSLIETCCGRESNASWRNTLHRVCRGCRSARCGQFHLGNIRGVGINDASSVTVITLEFAVSN